MRTADMARRIAIVIDIGSSSIRCSALESRGVTVAQVKIPHNVLQCKDSREILQICNIVNDALSQCIEQLRGFEGICTIASIGFATFVMNLVAIDNESKAPMCCIHYGSHNKSVIDHCNYLKGILNEDAILDHYAATGTTPLHPCYAYPHMHLLYTQQDNSSQNISWTTLAAYIISQWTSKTYSVSVSEAAWTGLLDLRTLQWINGIQTSNFLPPNHLPPIDIYPTASYLCSEYASKWPELAGAAIYPAIGDGYAANLGSDCTVNSNCIAVTIGTTAAARVLKPRHSSFITSKLWQYAVSAEDVLLGGSLTDGGSLLTWFGTIVGADRTTDIICDMRENYTSVLSQDHADVPLAMPFFSGERSTGYHYNASGCISNLTHDTTASHLLRSLMEGIMFRLGDIVDSIVAEDDAKRFCIVGSGLVLESEQLWRQMLADITGYTVLTLNVDASEVTTRGVWRYLQFCEGTPALEGDSAEIASTTVPIHCMHEYYMNRRKKHSILYNKLVSTY